MRIGFVGLGLMGRHMAASLLKAGHVLKVKDLRREAANELIAAGAQWAQDVATDADIVFTSVPGPAEVEAVAKEILACAKPGTAWFDLSTNSPDMVRKIHGLCAHKGVQFLDAPVSGGPKGAQSGKLAIMVGGDRATYERCLPVIKAIGDQPFHVGEAGAGTVAKLAHNVSSFMVQTALAEAFTLGVKAGVEPVALLRALRQGATGRARTFDRLVDQFLPGKYDPPAFALKLAHKDVSLALQLGKSVGVPMKAGEHALAELAEAMARGWQDRDCRVAMTLQEERAGVSVKVSEEKLKDVLA
ncbi:MAG: NAD(P)-dependent oxidoreductase [Betaproteobacteria bacterium]|nr:NAD(P)-dependent oxidoreductase [Betaproteobacteria bacterium]